MIPRRVAWIVCTAVCLSAGLRASGQAGCGTAPVPAADAQPNIFTDQQEMWLGQVEADLAEADIQPVRDKALGMRLQVIADRLVATLPPTQIQFKVILVDSDQINGFSIAGGHVYILRKLAAAARSDDELAGVIGHEIGHIISHQFAFETTRELKRLTNVTSVGDEADIRKKYSAMLDAEYHDKHPALSETDAEQAEADKIGLYAMTAAGYDPKAYAQFWDRMFFVEGKTGSRLGDLLGMTKPNQKRLRSISAMVAAIPAGCGEGKKPDRSDFAKWHEAVVANQVGVEEARSTALHEVTLTPALRMGLGQVRFSPDGKSLLAQDESSIFVLDREPFAVRYRIAADGALPASFSPDSQSVTFTTPGLHTEQWSVKENKLLAAHEMYPKKDCYDPRLSPDGRTMVCVELDFDEGVLGISLLDTISSEVIWEKKNWFTPSYRLATDLIVSRAERDNTTTFFSSYSPDGNTLLFGGGEDKIAFDLKDRSVMKTGGSIRGGLNNDYAFVGNDKVAGINVFDHDNSGIYSFPDGRKLEKISIRFTGLGSVTNAGTDEHVLAYGLKDYLIALADLPKAHIMAALKTVAMDEYRGIIAGEAEGGQLVLAELGNADATQQKHLILPISPLPFYPPTALSRDGRYLALSTRLRGGVWDLTTGKEVAIVRGFTDATWADDDLLYMDVPKSMDVERHISALSLKERALKDLSYKVTDQTHMRYGRLTDWTQDEKKKTWTLSMYDPSNSAVLWSRVFSDRNFSYTASFGKRDLIFNFDLSTHTAKDALKASDALAGQATAIKDKKNARLIEVLNGKTGEQDGSLVVDLPPNYNGVDGLNRAGELLYVAGVDDRTTVYSMATGKKVRELVGYVMGVDAASGVVFAANRVGEATVYDSEGKELAHYQLGDGIRYAEFRENATQVTILTADQKLRTMEVSAAH